MTETNGENIVAVATVVPSVSLTATYPDRGTIGNVMVELTGHTAEVREQLVTEFTQMSKALGHTMLPPDPNNPDRIQSDTGSRSPEGLALAMTDYLKKNGMITAERAGQIIDSLVKHDEPMSELPPKEVLGDLSKIIKPEQVEDMKSAIAALLKSGAVLDMTPREYNPASEKASLDRPAPTGPNLGGKSV